MKTIISIITAVFLAVSMSLISPAAANGADRAETTKSVSGIKATLAVSPDKSMVDLYLTDEATGREIRTAKVRALISTPGNPSKKIEKELIGMSMDGRFSFMNSLDMSFKGRYSFEIQVEHEKRRARFIFTYEKR
jgi:hypothetical protein